ncbi:HlyD family type I secretion periplasmic adaptor subunit [Halomonas organivorans]|uniref:Membrane fusion protein (MFP) family protein n=1 Tax=Halomonas organivorans TaxID=257772 RepID=A0A7W5G3I2_9GAMM|nr:HlyD family type I secretion periplasmic adaptor subunit [Halomonas organivorans]MBB3139323.1 adhesin transport system membrane fusion protein [Halomonas organivorans]
MMQEEGRRVDSRNLLFLDFEQDRYRQKQHVDDAKTIRSIRIIWWALAFFLCFGVWAYFADLVEVSSGEGKVIPSSREQVVESFEGGIVKELSVREGDIVEAGDVLAVLDPAQSEADVGEVGSRYRAALARESRLEAEVNEEPLVFPTELDAYPNLRASEQLLYVTRTESLKDELANIENTLAIVRQELSLTRSLANAGAASDVEVLKLRRQESELELQAANSRSEYFVTAREKLAEARADVEALSAKLGGSSDTLSRLTMRSPVRGIVKDIEVTTTGGVIPPRGRLMTIVPLDDRMLIETRISPRDIAFIHPGQLASVKLSAYDYSTYGAIEGEVVTISPDTVQDEADPKIFYYRVFVEVGNHSLENDAGEELPVVPGMVATVDIRTGSKTVFDYLVKPLSSARDALRER